ncbi:putative squamosa promoter-binding-like protein 16-like isoform 1 [Capsicum annuum]|nr:putative squamosa promoter-binding-like protein 16-like isoform 1 [Capsicum annuum]
MVFMKVYLRWKINDLIIDSDGSPSRQAHYSPWCWYFWLGHKESRKGIVGSVLAKEGRLPNVPDIFSGAFKIAWRQIRQDNSTRSTPKSGNASLMQQVNSLRQDLQLLASNRSVTIVTSSGSGSSRYTMIIVIVVMGYGYVWWKLDRFRRYPIQHDRFRQYQGWKLPELMFATRRSLSDACGSVSKQLESVYTSISATKRHLTSRIDRVDSKIDDCVDNTAATRDEVSKIRGKVRTFGEDVQSVHLVVQSLSETNYGVGKLVAFVRSIETSRAKEQIEAPLSSSSRAALELPSVASSAQFFGMPILVQACDEEGHGCSRTEAGSLPPNLSVEPSSPSASSVSPKRPLHGAISASGLKELGGISDVVEMSSESTPQVSNAVFTSEQRSNENSGFGNVFGRKFAGIGGSFITRSRSAMQSFK